MPTLLGCLLTVHTCLYRTGSTTKVISGTSAATAHVAGLATYLFGMDASLNATTIGRIIDDFSTKDALTLSQPGQYLPWEGVFTILTRCLLSQLLMPARPTNCCITTTKGVSTTMSTGKAYNGFGFLPWTCVPFCICDGLTI